jgi:aspartyl-tRNA(Asn)/glutamyl-tRNA(Gln) amidotransferase subunit A
MTLSWTMDKIGPLARTATDAITVLEILAGPDANDLTTIGQPAIAKADAERRPFATIKGAADRVQPEIASNFHAALDVLRGFGAIKEIELPDLPYNDVADLIIACEAAAAHEELVTSGQIAQLTAPEDRWRVYPDLMIPAVDYLRALRVRTLIQREIDQLLKGYSAIVTPTLATVAGPLDQPFGEWAKGFESTEIGAASNLAGIPAVTVPNGFGAGDLPTGLQFVGRAFDDRALAAIATEYQQRTGWHRKHPPEVMQTP